MKICIMYVSPNFNALKMKGMVFGRSVLTLRSQYMIFQYINTLLPIIPAFFDDFYKT